MGAWSQLKQNVPDYCGLGTVFEKMDKAGRLHQVKELYKNALFFSTLLGSSMMSLSKTNFDLALHVKKRRVWRILDINL